MSEFSRDGSGPWGQKVTVVAYFEGEFSHDDFVVGVAALNEAWPDARFVGMSVADVLSEPNDQVAT